MVLYGEVEYFGQVFYQYFRNIWKWFSCSCEFSLVQKWGALKLGEIEKTFQRSKALPDLEQL